MRHSRRLSFYEQPTHFTPNWPTPRSSILFAKERTQLWYIQTDHPSSKKDTGLTERKHFRFEVALELVHLCSLLCWDVGFSFFFHFYFSWQCTSLLYRLKPSGSVFVLLLPLCCHDLRWNMPLLYVLTSTSRLACQLPKKAVWR